MKSWDLNSHKITLYDIFNELPLDRMAYSPFIKEMSPSLASLRLLTNRSCCWCCSSNELIECFEYIKSLALAPLKARMLPPPTPLAGTLQSVVSYCKERRGRRHVNLHMNLSLNCNKNGWEQEEEEEELEDTQIKYRVWQVMLQHWLCCTHHAQRH